LPHAPIPASQNQTSLRSEKNLCALDDPDHFRHNQSRQRRCAPTLIGIRRNPDRLHSGTLIDITGIRN
jgi:hypothetical protein